MDIKDIPQNLLDKLRDQFDSDENVQLLRIEQRSMMSKGNYQKALEIAQTIEHLYHKVVLECMNEAENEVSKIDIEKIDMPSSDKEYILTLGIVMFMACDIIETAIMDVDDTLRKYDKDLRFEMFNDFRQIAETAKGKLQWLQENSGYMKDLIWADKCDNMYDMMKSKAKSIIQKRKNDPRWGENMKNVK